MERSFVYSREHWRKIIEAIEKRNQGLADTLAILAYPKLQRFLKKSEKEIKSGKLRALDIV